MKTRCINLYKQRQFFHLNTSKVHTKQTKPNDYVPKKDYNKEKACSICKDIQRLKQKAKEVQIEFYEYYIGRNLTTEEKKKLMKYL